MEKEDLEKKLFVYIQAWSRRDIEEERDGSASSSEKSSKGEGEEKGALAPFNLLELKDRASGESGAADGREQKAAPFASPSLKAIILIKFFASLKDTTCKGGNPSF